MLCGKLKSQGSLSGPCVLPDKEFQAEVRRKSQPVLNREIFSGTLYTVLDDTL